MKRRYFVGKRRRAFPRSLIFVIAFLSISVVVALSQRSGAVNANFDGRDEEQKPQNAEVGCLPAQLPQMARVVRVVDGDTIRVLIGGAEYAVRYIGIDAPEDTKIKERFGKEATDRNAALVGGKEALLYRDVSETDRYDRLLRYVLLPDGTFVNLALVADGYAKAATYPPDVACASVFLDAEQRAREQGFGLWKAP